MKSVVVLVTWNGASHVESCLQSLIRQTRPPQALIVIDNASRDDTLHIVNAHRAQLAAVGTELQVTSNEVNVGFTCAANQGMRYALSKPTDAEIVVLLNQDTVVHEKWMEALEDAFLQWPKAGAVGCKIFYPDGVTIQHAGGMLSRPRLVGSHHGHHKPNVPEYDVPREVDFVTGAAMALRGSALEQVGVFNEIFSPGYYEDVELCARMRAANWQVWYCPSATLKHAESASFTDWMERWTLSHRNRLLFALMHMRDACFRRDFEQAEAKFLQEEAQLDERRALSLAYGRAMLMARRVFAEGGSSPPMAHPEIIHAAVDVLARLRHLCLKLSKEAIVA
ncbi:glycosyltransferase family 2 protein [Candidatus Roseilinea sp. NK_OTU-006]|jgi:GT2 family glycosyltransferase|uniref:glycosyltransferase family 2 protein n=1 Tax=Candidatus Roseilinea sp. NK_OTU-006 TaxID=2704250 RepID=UPI00145EB491|nr:glycosyltransferase family 2 protein [Candidatus Roseilinea sp. NK_OTU-006]